MSQTKAPERPPELGGESSGIPNPGHPDPGNLDSGSLQSGSLQSGSRAQEVLTREQSAPNDSNSAAETSTTDTPTPEKRAASASSAPERSDSSQLRPHLDRKRQQRARRNRNWALFLLLAGPNMALILLFVYYPLVMNVRYSTLDWRLGADSAREVGLANYAEFLTSPKGLEVWRVTLIFTVATVIGTILIGLLMALVLNRALPGRTLVRTAIFSPYVLSGVGIGLVWNFVFDPRIGVLSHILAWFGKTSPEWFLDPTLSLIMVIIVYTWKNLGFAAVVILAGLQSVPADLLEASALDGAGSVRRFFSVVLPLLTPTMFFLAIVSILNSMQAFDVLRIMTPSGNGTNTIIFEIYLQTFGPYQRAGYGAAISVILFIVLFAITAIQMRFVERKVHYS